jgi:hypothetical protein
MCGRILADQYVEVPFNNADLGQIWQQVAFAPRSGPLG